MPEEPEAPPTPRKSAAGVVAAGIFLSRLMGFVREKAVAYFFGLSAYTDVFQAAFRGPGLLQNLLGEGTLSAAFIPVYSRLLEAGRAREAGRFAGAIFGLLLALTTVLVLLGIFFAEPLVTILTPGFLGDADRVAAGELDINRFDLLVRAVRLVFPMSGLLVLAAWTLGVLNSHRRFFIPYFAPVLWNVAILGGLFGTAFFVVDDAFGVGGRLPEAALNRLLFGALVGALVGGLLQFLVQLPFVLRLMKGFRPSLSTRVTGVREALNAFGPVLAGRGVYQFSAYLDLFLASWLAAGALGAIRPAQMLYILPISLFSMSVAASELPELSRLTEDKVSAFMGRLDRSLRQILFLIIPTMLGYLALGLLIVGGIFRGGAFGPDDTWLVYLVLGGYSLGLVATTLSRLLQNAFWALGDTKTPAVVAGLRVALSAAVAVPCMFWLNRYPVAGTLDVAPGDTPLYLGAVGLALGASVGAWGELWRLTTALRRHLGQFGVPWGSVARMAGLALLALGPALGVWWLLPPWPMVFTALVVVGLYGLGYLGGAWYFRFEEIHAWTGRLSHRFRAS